MWPARPQHDDDNLLYTMSATRDVQYRVFDFPNPANAYDRLAEELRGRKMLVVTTPSVQRLHGESFTRQMQQQGLDMPLRVLPCTERTKSLRAVAQVCEWAAKERMPRDGVLVAFGGGVLSDLVTTAASWIRRGIGHVRIPTTLIGQIDAGIGIKGAVNFQGRKGFLGCFFPPEGVLIAPALLATLSQPHLRCGLAEIVKIAVVADPALFRDLQEHGTRLLATRFQDPPEVARHVIRTAAARMLERLSTNLYERQSYEREVDLGHTFSQEIESASQFQIPHGEAVAMDLALSAALSQELGTLSPEDCRAIVELQLELGLRCWDDRLTVPLGRTSLRAAAQHRGGHANLVLPVGIGKLRFVKDADDIPDAALERAIQWLREATHHGHRTRRATFAAATATEDQECCLVLDIGGTSVRAALYRAQENSVGNPVCHPTPNHLQHVAATFSELKDRLLAVIRTAAAEALQGRTPDVVSIAFAGPFNAAGLLLAAPTVWGQKFVGPADIRAEFQSLWPAANLHVFNDVTAAGYRFLRHGREDLCVITVGSGIGNKLFLRGRPTTGVHGRGGEIGHIQVDPSLEAPVCECGGRGHLGAIASGRGALQTAQAIAKQAPEAFRQSLPGRQCDAVLDRLACEHLVAGFHARDAWTCELIRRIADPLGRVIASIHLSVGVERFVIYGGFGLALGEDYRGLLVAAAQEAGWQAGQDWNQMIEFGATDSESGLLGAGRAVSYVLGSVGRPSPGGMNGSTAPRIEQAATHCDDDP